MPVKEIIAIIRPKKMGATRDALDKLGFPGLTAVLVLGRGKQHGIAGEVNVDLRPGVLAMGGLNGMKYVPKRLLAMVVRDSDVDAVAQTIIDVNQTGEIGDGRIFICPIESVTRIRTDEEGEKAIL